MDVDVDVVVAVAAMQDKYILSSMALLCCVCLWHAIVPYIQSRLVDVVVLATFACVYLLSHLAFYIFIYIVVSTPTHLHLILRVLLIATHPFVPGLKHSKVLIFLQLLFRPT